MQQRTQLILTATATFFAGLLTGATVFSDVLREPPPVPESVSVPEMVSEPLPAEEAVPDVASVTVPESAPEPPQDAEPDTEPALSAVSPEVTDALAARIEELTDGWGRMQAELAELRQRVARVERDAAEPDAEAADNGQRRRPASPAEQRDALLRAGVTAEVADDLIWQRSQLSLARLDLRDEAARDGWLGTSRYREALRRINEQQVSIEDAIGLDAYDRYLYETGQPNRVAVDSVIPGSAGEEGGLQPGDVIERYGDAQVLEFQDLREATSAGARGELVPVTVRRDGQVLEVWLPRGPIGIGLDVTRVAPDS